MITNKNEEKNLPAIISYPVFHLSVKQNNIGVISIDVPGEKVNTLKAEFVDQFYMVLQQAQTIAGLKGIIIISNKPGCFIAGADISMIANCKTKEEATQLAVTGQKLFNLLDNYPLPVVAAIDGVCLGGGLELALACHIRICTLSEKTRLGLPEVQLGLIPGSGGTQRLPRLIGLINGLNLILTGRQLRPKQSLKLGLVDDIVPAEILLETAISWIDKGRKGKTYLPRMQRLSQLPIIRNILFAIIKNKTNSKSKGHYPALEKAISVVTIGYEKGVQAGLKAEAKAFGELVMTPESAALRGLFFGSTSLKSEMGSFEKSATIHQVGVLGGGLMGSGIAYVTATRGKLPVRVKDINNSGLDQALKFSWHRLTEQVSRKRISVRARDQQMMLISGTLDYKGLEKAQIIVEAVFEDLALKRKMVQEVEAMTLNDVVFASNTSSLPIHKIAEFAKHPERIIGLHYFSPVDKMPLVEVIPHSKTSDKTIATAVALAKKQGKTAIVVADGAGFYVNRILAPYIAEATRCLLAGESIEHIDNALVKFGFPVGPLNLLDEVGIDVGTKIMPVLVEQFGERFSVPSELNIILEDDRKGRKNGRGFYLYKKNKISWPWYKKQRQVDTTIYELLNIQPKTILSDQEIVQRCIMLMLNEATRCLDEGVIRHVNDGEIGAVFGIGFPPFTGGPFRYMDQQGISNIVDIMHQLAQKYGNNFVPCERLVQMAKSNKKFYQ